MPSTSSVVSGVAGRYAAALFELAEEQKNLDDIAADAASIRALLAESADLRRLVASPVIGREEQGQAIAAVLEKAGISELTRNFVGVVAKTAACSRWTTCVSPIETCCRPAVVK